MKYCKPPSLLDKALQKLGDNLEEDFDEFWPVRDVCEIHEANMVMHLAAILKRKDLHVYAEVSTNDHSRKHIDFVALRQQKDWCLLCEAKRGYTQNHITGISSDIRKICEMGKDKCFKKYSRAYGLILVTCWTGFKGRALIKIWDDLPLANASFMDKACGHLKEELDKLSAKRDKLFIQEYKKSKHYLLYALFEIDRLKPFSS